MIFKPSLKFIVSSIIAIILICITIGLYDVSVKHSFASDYYPSDFINSFKTHIHLDNNDNIYVDSEGLALLNSNDVKLQILDKNNKEVYSYNKPKDYPKEYNNEILIQIQIKLCFYFPIISKEMIILLFCFLILIKLKD